MNADQLTFGIEIETTVPAGALTIGSYSQGAAVPGLPEGWTVKYDGSIRANRGRRGAEFVSPVLRGADGLKQIIEVCRVLTTRYNARVNASTGLHVHVGCDNDPQVLDKLVTLTANFEKAIFATTGTKRRERGQWCGSVQRWGNVDTGRQQASRYRYHLLNLTNIATGRRPAVEFRAFSGTLNAGKIIGYVRLCLGLVERAYKAKRITNWAPSPWPLRARFTAAAKAKPPSLASSINWAGSRAGSSTSTAS